MRRTVIFLFLLSFFIIPSSLFSQEIKNDPTNSVVALVNELSIEEIQNIIFYFNQKGGLLLAPVEKERIIFLLENILHVKTLEKSQRYTDNPSSLKMREEVYTYRVYEIASILEGFFQRDIFLDKEGNFTLSTGTPIIKEENDKFSLHPYQEPPLPLSILKEGSALEVFLESVKYPNYTSLYWNNEKKEYGIFLEEYDEFIYLEDIDNLERNKLIVLFGKLFPISLEKPAWAWRLFGIASIKRESKDLIYKENQAKKTFNS